jgi:hypothetical protein
MTRFRSGAQFGRKSLEGLLADDRNNLVPLSRDRIARAFPVSTNIVPSSWPQGKHLHVSKNNRHLSMHFGLSVQVFDFSLFFSLKAGNTRARTVRTGVRGAPFRSSPMFMNHRSIGNFSRN